MLSFGRPHTNLDSAANDSDKTITVPASQVWELQCVHISLVTTATVGNRQVEVRVTDGSDNVIWQGSAGAVQAASLTRVYEFFPSAPLPTAFTDGKITVPMPAMTLEAGWKIRVLDNAAVDAAADDMTVSALYRVIN